MFVCSALVVLAFSAPRAVAQEEAKLVSLDAAGGDFLGHSVGLSGDAAILGATGDKDFGIFSGSAYIFVNSGGGWTQQDKLNASDAGISQRFGWSAGIDGDTAVVGAIFGNGLAPVSGSAYVFTRSGTTWTEQAKLVSSDGASSDWYSRSLAISGETIAIGAAQDDDLGSDSGSVYVYDRVGAAWSETVKLKALDGAANDTFGEALSLAGDLLVVGSPQDDDAGSSSGSAYVFRRVSGSWSQVAKLTANDAHLGAWFGKAVHTDGVRVVVGAYRSDGSPTNDSGAAYVFAEGSGVWSQEAKLVASDASGGDEFGWSVDIRDDEVRVGAPSRNSDTGAVYRYRRSGGTWSEDSILIASDASADDVYGWALASEGDGVLVGADRGTTPAGNSGAAYVLRFAPAFTAYCFGDGSGTACPCANVGATGAGCGNSAGSGALAGGAGSVSLALDDLTVNGAGLAPSQPALLFAGLNAISGGQGLLFGDGLRCAGGSIQRLGIHAADTSGAATWGPGLGASAGWSTGDTRNLQLWYRDPAGPCGSGFNLSNGLTITLEP